jgi:hypothetical protein
VVPLGGPAVVLSSHRAGPASRERRRLLGILAPFFDQLSLFVRDSVKVVNQAVDLVVGRGDFACFLDASPAA